MPTPVPGWFGFERSWLARGMNALERNSGLFIKSNTEEAQNELGLGNQQVFALEYWLRVLGLITKCDTGYHIDHRGELLRIHDPHFEEPLTWYLIHYWLASNREAAYAYWTVANIMPSTHTRESLIEKLSEGYPGKSQSTYFNYTRVFFAIVRGTPIGQQCEIFRIANDEIISEAVDPNRASYPFLGYVFIDWAARNSRSTAWIPELCESNAPGRQLSLAKDTVERSLDVLQDRYSRKVLWVSRTAGLDSVAFAAEYRVYPLALLRAAYLERLEGLEPLVALEHGLRDEKEREVRKP